MQKFVLSAAIAALVILGAPAAAGAACKFRTATFKGDVAKSEGLSEAGAPVEGGKLRTSQYGRYIATSDVTLTYRHVEYKIDKGTDFGVTCFRALSGARYKPNAGSNPLVSLGEGMVDVRGDDDSPAMAGVSMRYGLFHVAHPEDSHFTVRYHWVDVAVGKGRATLATVSGPAVGFSPGSVAALKGTCQAGEKMVVDWKGVRQG